MTSEKNEALYRVKKVENQIQSLNSALESYGYLDNLQGSRKVNNLDSLKVVLQENERLKDEMRTMIEASMKDRQMLEATQREAIRELPTLVTKQYKSAIEEYERKNTLQAHSHAIKYDVLQKEFNVQRERLIKIIEEKSNLEHEVSQLKLAKRELSEQLGHKTRKVKELKATGYAVT